MEFVIAQHQEFGWVRLWHPIDGPGGLGPDGSGGL